jgi:hypothetical protein
LALNRTIRCDCKEFIHKIFGSNRVDIASNNKQLATNTEPNGNATAAAIAVLK